MKKVLFVASVPGHIRAFHLPFLKMFKDKGYEVHIATNREEDVEFTDVRHIVSFQRNPFKLNNIKAIKQLKKIIDENNFKIIHCHTPMASVVTRIAAKDARNNGTRVIYTAHGFHFFKGAPLLNWIMFYPIEKYLSKYTDDIITINDEDYQLAKNKFTKCKNIHYVPGVGVDESKFNFEMTDKEKSKLRKETGIKKSDIVLMYTAELNKNKNQGMAIKTIKELVKENNKYKLILIGGDSLNGKYQKMVKKFNLENNIIFLGHRKDLPNLLKIANIVISTSKREGLPVNLIEAKMSGLPIVATDCRGNRDLANYVVKINDVEDFVDKIKNIRKSNANSINDEKEKYNVENVVEKVKLIYEHVEKKRVLHILNTASYSGAENVVLQIINNTKEEFNHIYMALDKENGNIDGILKENNIENYLVNKISTKEITKIVKEKDIDIVHAHDYTTSILAAFSNINKCKLISHIHNNSPWIKKYCLNSFIYLISSIKYNKILLVSDSITDEYVFGNIIKRKCQNIGNPIDTTLVKSKVLNVGKDKYDICFLGRLSKPKDPIKFLEIIKEVNLEKNIKAVIIGDGPLKNECIDYIKNNNLEKVVELKGFLENPYNDLASSKILVVTSKWEGFGLMVVEALSLGKPVISTKVGGIKEILNNESGIFCNDVNEFKNNILKLLSNNDVYSKYQTGSLERANQLNNIDNYIQIIKYEYYNKEK